MKHGSLFSGIGGFDLASSWMGWENVFQVEIDPYCQKVLQKNFPDTKRHLNIFDFDGSEYKGAIDIISGGFPCQPFSAAGKRKGSEDDRHLWPQMLRVIGEVQPRFVVAENVPGLLSIQRGLVFERVCADLEVEGYEVQPVIIPACGKGAIHKRDRIWFVAYSDQGRVARKAGNNIPASGGIAQAIDISQGGAFTYASEIGLCGTSEVREMGRSRLGINHQSHSWDLSEIEPTICRVHDGVSAKLDEARLMGLGNAIVPQVAYEIFKAIELTEMNLKVA